MNPAATCRRYLPSPRTVVPTRAATGIGTRRTSILLSDGLGERLVGKPSTAASCDGHAIIDPQEPERSLLLTRVRPGSCGGIMPPGTEGIRDEDYACLADWVEHFAEEIEPVPEDEFCDEFEEVRPEIYVSKVKTLMTGERASADEVARVEADPAALRALAREWIDTPAFEARLLPFLQDTLQFSTSLEDLDDKLTGIPEYQPYIEANLAESYVRTMMRIIAEDRPFTEIATTTTWEVTTFTLAVLTLLDASEDERRIDHSMVLASAADPISLQESIATHVWPVPEANSVCAGRTRRGSDVLSLLAGRCQGSQNMADPVLQLDDFTDWRTVELVPAGQDEPDPAFWDIVALREAQTELPVGMPRVGFLTHPAFLSRWETNADNRFRVTTNQALLVMTGHTFEAGDTTEPLGLDGLDAEHADPESACYGCHRALDPMRLFYENVYDYEYFGLGAERGALTPAYTFRGTAELAEDLYDFADILATNPDFATAWTQKLCHWANSQGCDEDDPEFQRVGAVFEEEGFSFKTLVVELLTSPLTTGAAFTETYCSRQFLVSITRRDQLCHALDVRLGTQGLCDDGRLAKLVELIPEDAIARGEPNPVQNPVSSAFHAAGVEQFCVRLAEDIIEDGADPDAVLGLAAGGLMGIPVDTPRYDEVLGILGDHYAQAQAQAPVSAGDALRSAFTLACTSSNLQAIGL